MKRLLAIFVSLLLVLGGLFWWRKTSEQVFNNNFFTDPYRMSKDEYDIPLAKNKTLFKYNETYTINDFSAYRSLPTFDDIKIDGIWNCLSYGSSEIGEYPLAEINKFIVKDNQFVFKSEGLYFIFKLNFGPNFEIDRSLELPNFISNESNLKKPDEWFNIWEEKGRLPWFPEYVGR